MARRKKGKIQSVRHSCLSGKTVWTCLGVSTNAAYKAYKRACSEEMKRINMWAGRAGSRKANIVSLLANLTERLPLGVNLSPLQHTAARLLSMAANDIYACYRGFYEHITAEHRKKKQ